MDKNVNNMTFFKTWSQAARSNRRPEKDGSKGCYGESSAQMGQQEWEGYFYSARSKKYYIYHCECIISSFLKLSLNKYKKNPSK